MSHSCPTVHVKALDPEQGEFIIVNKSDYDADPSKFELVDLPPPPMFAPPAPPPPGVVDPLDGLGLDWKDKDAADLMKLAAVVSGGRSVDNKAQAIEVIDVAMLARTK